jgi:tetratricopeptide (TPR) repeat protein
MMVSQEAYAEALDFTEQALGLARKLKDRFAEAWTLTHLGFAQMGIGDLENAAHRFQAALDIRYSFSQQSLAMEPLAGLAQVELDKNNLVDALSLAENIISYLTNDGTLEGTEEPIRIYMTVYQTLIANHDSRAGQILEDAHSLLQDQVSKIQEKTYKEMFIQNVPWRRKIEEIWRQNQTSKGQDT